MAEVQQVAVHVRYDGRSYEFDATVLDIGELNTDEEILARVAEELGADNLRGFVIDRDAGNFTVRPQAVFGHHVNKRSHAQIEKLWQAADDGALGGSNFGGMNYEEGVQATLAWLFEDGDYPL